MSDKAYSKAVKGKLSFKGVKMVKKVKRTTEVDKVEENSTEHPSEQSSSTDQNDNRSSIENAAPEEIKIVSGTGRMTSSGTTILGHDTLFMSELTHGDAIIVTHPSTYVDETKIVRMVLSNISISISSAFSTDLITTSPFRFIKAPKVRLP